jgi:4-amino-4-deoxy-L-arabinose transferase-like glycosyltransferase
MIMVFAALGVFLLRLTRNHREGMNFQTKLFLSALGIRFLLSIITYEFGLVKVLGDEDASGWYVGVIHMQRWTKMNFGLLDLPGVLSEAFYQQNLGYHYMLGGFFFVTGLPGRMSAAALNCFFGALTVVFTYRVAKSMFSNWAAVRAGWAVCFFPSLIIWSAQTVKEPVVILLESIALYACVHLKLTGFSLRYAVLCGSAILLLLPFRFYAAYLAAAAAMIALLIPQFGKGRFSAHSGILVAALVIPLALSSGILARSEAEFEKFDINRIERFRFGVAYGAGSGVKSTYDLKTPSGLAMGVAVGAAHLFLAPFPWQLGGASMRMLGTVPELVVWWWLLFVGFIPGLKHAIKMKFNELQPFLFFIVGMGLLYSMMFGNVGLIVRQRSQLLPWLLILAMVGLEQRAIKKILKRRQQVRAPIVPQPGRA